MAFSYNAFSVPWELMTIWTAQAGFNSKLQFWWGCKLAWKCAHGSNIIWRDLYTEEVCLNTDQRFNSKGGKTNLDTLFILVKSLIWGLNYMGDYLFQRATCSSSPSIIQGIWAPTNNTPARSRGQGLVWMETSPKTFRNHLAPSVPLLSENPFLLASSFTSIQNTWFLEDNNLSLVRNYLRVKSPSII